MSTWREAVGGRIASFGHALSGLAFVVRNEPNARLHLAATVVVVALGALLRISAADWRWLALAIAIVWLAEVLNTAIEHLCDVVSPDHKPAVRLAKDVASGAVLIAALAAAVLGLMVFLPYLR